MCDQCLLGNSEARINSAYVDKWQWTEITRDGQVAVTRQNQDSADADRVNGITDLVEAGSIVAIAAADRVWHKLPIICPKVADKSA